jgi:hypothetical protein
MVEGGQTKLRSQRTKREYELPEEEEPKEAPVAKKASLLERMWPKKLAKYRPDGKSVLDATLFAGAFYVIYNHGKDLANALDANVPSEKDMLEMMQQ